MVRFADPTRCPSCGGPIVAPVCPTCGLRLVGATAGELYRTLQQADSLLEQLRAESTEPPAAAPSAAPAASPAASPAAAPAAAATPTPAPAAPTAPPRRATTIPAVLLSLGAISLASGALIFLVIAWFLLGVAARTAALVLLTAALAAATWFVARRGLRAAAETLGTLTALFAGFDLIGARLAWFDAADLRAYCIVAGLLLCATCAGGIAALRARTRLWGPEAVGAVGLVVAAVAVLATDHHVPVAMSLVMAGGAALAWGTRRIQLPVLWAVSLVLAVVAWVLLVGYGVIAAVDDQRAAWSTIGPLATAAAAAIAVAVLAPTFRAVAGTVGVWLLVGAAVGWTDWFQTPSWGLLTVTAVAAVGYALWSGPWRGAGLGVGLTGTVVLLTAAVAWTIDLAQALADAGAQGWVTRFSADHHAPPWSALAAFLLLTAPSQRTPRLRRHPSIATVGVVAAGLTAAGYVHWSIVPAAFLLVAAVLETLLAMRSSRWHWLPAVVLAAAAGACAAVGPAPESVVWWAAAALGVVVLLRERTPDRVIAAASAPAVLVTALLFDGDALEVERRWTGPAAIVLVYGAALVLRPRAARPALAAGTLAAMLAAAAVGATSEGWLAAELTVVAAGCAVAGILDRSRVEGIVATALGLVALWLRLAASDVHTPEAYSLPLAAVVLLVGGRALHGDTSRRTVPTIGAGLALALVPTWALGVVHPLSLRALLAGIACVALVAAGAQLRWMAPLLLGAGAGTVLAIVEIAPYANAVPRWALLVGIGACLLAAGIRWEALAAAGRRTWGRVVDLR